MWLHQCKPTSCQNELCCVCDMISFCAQKAIYIISSHTPVMTRSICKTNIWILFTHVTLVILRYFVCFTFYHHSTGWDVPEQPRSSLSGHKQWISISQSDNKVCCKPSPVLPESIVCHSTNHLLSIIGNFNSFYSHFLEF